MAAVLGPRIPLAPLAVLPVGSSMCASVMIAAVVLFALGACRARSMVGHPGKIGLEMAIIGTLSALVGYAVGALLKIPATP